jgi:hypothetical protein
MTRPSEELAAKVRESITKNRGLLAAVRGFTGLEDPDAKAVIEEVVDAWEADEDPAPGPVQNAILHALKTVADDLEGPCEPDDGFDEDPDPADGYDARDEEGLGDVR